MCVEMNGRNKQYIPHNILVQRKSVMKNKQTKKKPNRKDHRSDRKK